MDNRIIIIDDDQDFLEILKGKLIAIGYKKVTIAWDPKKVVTIFNKGGVFDAALIDMSMPNMDGIELLEAIKETSPRTECVMVTAMNEARIAVECLKKGAYDYLVKPISNEDLAVSINRALERKRLLDIIDIGKSKILPELVNKEPFKHIITRSPKILKILKEAELHAGSDVPVLITGESGTGKELLAKAIHAASPRAKFPFTPINMASLTGSLFEAEFFGHTKGAFTGAEMGRVGYLEYTNRGTLFLDEIGNLPLELQGKLLRVLQDGEYIKLGTSRHQKADIRIIAATNQDLDDLMRKGMFRKDLYYRIRGGRLHLPPLKERQEDIPLLISKFLERDLNHTKIDRLEEDTMRLLLDYDYPGNIRELMSIVQSTVNLAQGRTISIKFLPDYIQKRKPISKHRQPSPSESIASLAQVEKSHILKAYSEMGKNKSQTARILGIGLNTLRRKLKSYGEI